MDKMITDQTKIGAIFKANNGCILRLEARRGSTFTMKVIRGKSNLNIEGQDLLYDGFGINRSSGIASYNIAKEIEP